MRKFKESLRGEPITPDNFGRNYIYSSYQDKDIINLQDKAEKLNTLLIYMLNISNSSFVIEYTERGLWITFKDIDENDYGININAFYTHRDDKIRIDSISHHNYLSNHDVSFDSNTKQIADAIVDVIEKDNIL